MEVHSRLSTRLFALESLARQVVQVFLRARTSRSEREERKKKGLDMCALLFDLTSLNELRLVRAGSQSVQEQLITRSEMSAILKTHLTYKERQE